MCGDSSVLGLQTVAFSLCPQWQKEREREREERARERESKSYMENSGKDMNVLKKDQKTLDLHSIPYEYICLY